MDDGRGGRGGAQRARRSKAVGWGVCVPQPSPDQAGSGWGTRAAAVS